MSEHDSEGQQNNQQTHSNQQDGEQRDTSMDTLLESRIAHILHKRASYIHFTPTTRAQVMARILPRQQLKNRRRAAFTFAITSVVAVVIIAIVIQSLYRQQLAATPIHFALSTTMNTPSALAQGGQLASLDPTGQHIVYQSAQGVGVMYTANVQNPYTSNFLAMRNALAASWSPDGSALVATIEPADSAEPFLAIIHTGSYMSPLGHTALAASWSPTIHDQIVYVTQTNGVTQLFATTPQTNHSAQLLVTLHIPMTVQHLVWSPNGQTLALITTSNNGGTVAQRLAQPADAIYLLNMQTYSVKELVAPGNFTLGPLAWSPDSHYLSYERIDSQDKTTIQAAGVTTQHRTFSITPKGPLKGWNWSPRSDAIVYSDNGTLAAYVLHGTAITFAQNSTEQISPLWLPDGRILCLNIVQGTGILSILATQQTR